MKTRTNRGLSALAGLLSAWACGVPVMADDTELFVVDGDAVAASPNILFIFDTSGSMDAAVESQEPYDPAKAYEGACASSRLYWRTDSGEPPPCDTDRWFEASAFVCAAGRDAFETSAGRLTDRFARFDAEAARWEALSEAQREALVECEDDAGRHGDGLDTSRVYAQSGVAGEPWSEDGADEIGWSSRSTYTVYSANYLNWYHGPTGPSTRARVMKDVATGLVGGINDVNIGVMRFNSDQGGRLVHAVEDVAGHRDALIDAIENLPASGWTPLSETMYEAARYFLGESPHYGEDPGPGVADGLYQSPVTQSCQKNYVVYLSDGEPSQDTDATERVPELPGFTQAVGTSCDGSGDGACLDDLAEYLHEIDLAPDVAGKQNAVTYTIGFAVDLPLLAQTAERGGGRYYTAEDTATLSQVLTNIVTAIMETHATFTAPAVAVDNFNRARHRNDLYVTVFQPDERVHWPGNLKKYRLRAGDGAIVDADGQPAVDPDTGFFSEHARSFWSETPDGRRVEVGGAASRLPAPDERRVYTWLADSRLTASANAVTRANNRIDEDILGLGDPDDPARGAVIDFMRGIDVADANGDGRTDDAHNRIGDPLHASPVSVVYGGADGDGDGGDAVVFFGTNDGYLHAVDPETGVEKWAFVPPEFLADQVRLLENATASSKHYGIDGDLSVHVIGGEDGEIDPGDGDAVHLYFGLRRGGTSYYALDVTDPDAPSVLWQLDEDDLPGVGQSWSRPVPTRIAVDDPGQNEDERVVVFGGGYDETQDNHTASTDDIGNAVYVVDALSGELLWHGGRSGGTKRFADMRYSMPADVKVVDLDGDGRADRMYAADMGGQVWRFDVSHGNTPSGLVNGGVIAQLGSAAHASPSAAETRRFYYAPDVALVNRGGRSFVHVGIGSGYRAHPNSTDNEDRFYALRDHEPFRQLSQSEFDTRAPITEDDLTDVTDDLDAAPEAGGAGWYLRLATGEKVLAEARTFNNEVFFTTFTPGEPDANDCVPRLGTNRLYNVSLFNGAPPPRQETSVDDDEASVSDGDGELTAADRSREFAGSIASGVSFLFPSPDDPDGCSGEDCAPPPLACVDLFCFPTGFGNAPIRTYWSQENLDR